MQILGLKKSNMKVETNERRTHTIQQQYQERQRTKRHKWFRGLMCHCFFFFPTRRMVMAAPNSIHHTLIRSPQNNNTFVIFSRDIYIK